MRNRNLNKAGLHFASVSMQFDHNNKVQQEVAKKFRYSPSTTTGLTRCYFAINMNLQLDENVDRANGIGWLTCDVSGSKIAIRRYNSQFRFTYFNAVTF